jgi:hypothetical protein
MKVLRARAAVAWPLADGLVRASAANGIPGAAGTASERALARWRRIGLFGGAAGFAAARFSGGRKATFALTFAPLASCAQSSRRRPRVLAGGEPRVRTCAPERRETGRPRRAAPSRTAGASAACGCAARRAPTRAARSTRKYDQRSLRVPQLSRFALTVCRRTVRTAGSSKPSRGPRLSAAGHTRCQTAGASSLMAGSLQPAKIISFLQFCRAQPTK